MHVVIAPGSMGSAITAAHAAQDLATPWRAGGHRVQQVPMSTGASGLIGAVAAVRSGRSSPIPVAQDSAVVEMLTCGRDAYLEPEPALSATVDQDADDGLLGSTAPVAEAMLAARQCGAERIVIGLGASAVHDGGMGLLAELTRQAGYDGEISTRALEAVRGQWSGIAVEVAAGTDMELTGLHGAGAQLAHRPGWDARRAQQVESHVGSRAGAWERAAAASVKRNLLQDGRRLVRTPYSGAGGGAAFALALIGGRVRSGARLMAAELELDKIAAQADLLITACETLDGEALSEGVPGAVGECALAQALPVIAVAWEILSTRTDDARAGITTTYRVQDPRLSGPDRRRPTPPEDRYALQRRAQRIVNTWAQ